MSFLVKVPQVPQSATQDGSQVSTYREAESVPTGYGRDRFVSHWLCQPYDRKTRTIDPQQSDMQMCSIAAGYRDGPIDFVGKLWRGGQLIRNLDFTFSEHGDPESQEFAITELGQFARAIVHRGTADAPASIADHLNEQTGQNHPPYRGYAWIEWLDIDLGQGTTALPDLQIELGRKTPPIGAFGASGFGQWGVNPFAATYAILTGETGFGIDATLFDSDDWATLCQALEDIGISDRTGIDTFCHPIFKSAQEAATLLSTILAHVDAFLYVDAGKFRIGWFPSKAPDLGSLPEITEHDVDSVPSAAEFPDWNRGPSSVSVVFRDFDRNYGDTPALCPAPANRESGVSANPARADRPQIHVADQAAKIAAEIAASRASSESSITLGVLKSRAVRTDGAPLMPGDLFVWDYAPHSLDLVVRVVGRRIRSGQTSDLLEIIPERGQFPLPYVAPVEPRVLPSTLPPGEVTAADVRLWLLPSALAARRSVAVLVNRAHRGIYRVDLHLSTTGAAPWDVILDSRLFAAKCTVGNGGVLSGTGTVRVTSTSVDCARFAVRAQNAVGQADDTLCLLLGDELCSVGSVTAVAPNTYDLAILRGRRGTAAVAHGDGSLGWLFLRDEVASNLAEHAEFYRVRDGTNTYNAGIATKFFKLQLYTIDDAGLAKPDDPGIALQLPDLSADGTLGYTIELTNEAHTVACDSSGNVNAGQLGASSTAKTDVKVMRGGTPLTPVAVGPNSDQFSISISAVTNATGTKEDNDTVRADVLFADTGTIEIAVLVAGAFTVPKVFSLTKAKSGSVGGPGPTGGTGPTGSSVERRYIRSTLVPPTPFGNNPIGWTTSIPSGSDALWVSEAVRDSAGNVVGSWSTPQRLEGGIVFYQPTAPSPASYTLVEGDLWFDTDDGYRPHRRENPGSGFQWVAKPFGDAAIDNLAAGKLTAGTIQAAISIGTLGSLSAGFGFGQFFVDSTQLKHGALIVNQYPGWNGTQMNMVSGVHQMTAYAYDLAAAVFVQNNGSGKQAGLFDDGLVRGNSVESGTDGFLSNGASTFNSTSVFNSQPTFNAQSNFNGKMRLLGANRFEFSADGSGNTYFDEGWGARAHGDGQHPFQIRGAALCLDGCSGGGTTYVAGRVYLTDTIYLHVVGGALWLNDSAGNRPLT